MEAEKDAVRYREEMKQYQQEKIAAMSMIRGGMLQHPAGQSPAAQLQPEDVTAAENILGPSQLGLMGKTTRKTPQQIVSSTVVGVPLEISVKYKNVVLSADFMFVNQIPFLNTISHGLKFITTRQMAPKAANSTETFKIIKKFYALRGFRITEIRADGQFEPIRGDLAEMKIMLNTTSEAEHVGAIERLNRTMKERIRGVYNELMRVFGKIPGVMVRELVYTIAFWLNSLPPADGVSDAISPRTLLTGLTLDFTKHCMLEYGEYVHTHEDGDNSMASRTLEALALRPSGNRQGGYLFLNIHTGRIITRRAWTALPMTSRVQKLIRRQARRFPATLEVLDGRGNEVPDNDEDQPDDSDDEDYNPSDDDDDEDDGDYGTEADEAAPASDDEVDDDDAGNDGTIIFNQPPPDHDGPIAGVATNHDDNQHHHGAIVDDDANNDDGVATNHDDNQHHHGTIVDDDANNDDANNPNEPQDAADALTEPAANDGNTLTEPAINEGALMGPNEDQYDEADEARDQAAADANLDQDEDITGVDNSDENEGIESEERSKERARRKVHFETNLDLPQRKGYSLRDQLRNGVDIDEQRGQIHSQLEEILLFAALEQDSPIAGMTMTQYNLRAGIKKFGDRAMPSVEKEIKQLDDMDALDPDDPATLTKEDRKFAMAYLMFLKEKRDGTLKARGCCDGRVQRNWMTKEETSSPTVSQEAFLLSCVTEAWEGRHVAVADVPGAFLQTKMEHGEKLARVRLSGVLAEVLMKVNPERYADKVTIEGGQKVIYAVLRKSLSTGLSSRPCYSGGTCLATLSHWDSNPTRTILAS